MPDCSRPPEGVSTARPAPSSASERRDDPVRGILLVVAAVFFLSISDATAKYLAQTLPSVEIAWMRYVGFSALLLPLMIRGGPAMMRSARPGLQILRGLGMLGSALLFIKGIHYLPLAEAAAASYVSPVFVTVLSILFLGEKIGPHRWAAVLIGLLGVMIVIRPGGAAFQPAAIFPILSAMSWATGVIVTRKMIGEESPSTTLIWSALTGLVVLTLLLPFDFVMPTWTEIALGGLLGLVSTIGQWLMVQAYRFGEASVLTPCAYVQIVWSSLLGFLIFGALPDDWTFLGAGIIIASGIYTAHRERLRRMQQNAAASS